MRLTDCKLMTKVLMIMKSMSSRRPPLLVELMLQMAIGLLIAFLYKKTTCVYLYGNLSAQANSFNTGAVRLNSTKVCENTIRERELVLLNFKM